METLIPPTTNHRYKQLDSLRGIAALTVFMGHFMGITAVNNFNSILPTPLGILFNGNAAVMFFFLLSGFVLSLPFVSNDKPLKLTVFYVKRIFRLYPAFIVAILLALLLKQFLFDKNAMVPFSAWIKTFWNWDFNKDSIKHILRTLLLIGPQFKTTFIDAPIWSLIIEMKMSLILPFFIMIVSRGNALFNILFLVVVVYLTYQHDSWATGVFYLGVLMARYKEPLLQYIRHWHKLVLLSAMVLAAFLYNNYFEFLNQYLHLKMFHKEVWSDYLIAIGSCIFMMIVLASKPVSNFLERRIFIFFGDISYSFYLMHLPILLTVTSLLNTQFSFGMAYIFLLSLILTIGISYLLFVFIERPFQKLAVKLIKRFTILNITRSQI